MTFKPENKATVIIFNVADLNENIVISIVAKEGSLCQWVKTFFTREEAN
jgi:hypothetical protein